MTMGVSTFFCFSSLWTSVYISRIKLLTLYLVRGFVSLFAFLFVCLFVCLFLLSLSGRKDNLIFFYIIIFTFLETQSPSTSPPPSKYTSVPFLFFKLIARLFFWSISLACNSNNLNSPGFWSPRSPHPLGMNTVVSLS